MAGAGALAAAAVAALAALGASRAACTLLHEWGHLAAALLLASLRGSYALAGVREGVLTSGNLRGNRGLRWWLHLASLGAFGSVGLPAKKGEEKGPEAACAQVEVRLRGGPLAPAERAAVELAGLAASLAALAAAAALPALPDSPLLAAVRLGAVLGAGEVLAGAVASDLFHALRPAPGRFLCGNFGALVRRSLDEWGYVPSWLWGMLQYMIQAGPVPSRPRRPAPPRPAAPWEAGETGRDGAGRGQVTMVRGGQAGGLVTFVSSGPHDLRGIRERVVNGKRTDLGVVLVRAMRRLLAVHAVRACLRRRNPSPAVLCMGHTRFATSSFPAVGETHPHQWLPRRDIYITHNGDFDFYDAFGKDQTYENIGLWLEKVHGHANLAKGDSPKIAGMVDLLATQGLWPASVKLAYYTEISYGLDAVFEGGKVARDSPSAAPPDSDFKAVADVFEALFEKHARALAKDAYVAGRLGRSLRGLEAGGRAGPALVAFLQAALRELEARALELRLLSGADGEARRRFAAAAVEAFVCNDIYTATRAFLHHARGSFGLVVGSALEEGAVVVSARGQPMSVAYSPEASVVLFGSEHAALKVPFGAGKPGAPEFRYDLDEVRGEVIEVRLADMPRLRLLRRLSTALALDGPTAPAAEGSRRGRPGRTLSATDLEEGLAAAPVAALAALRKTGSLAGLSAAAAGKLKAAGGGGASGSSLEPESGTERWVELEDGDATSLAHSAYTAASKLSRAASVHVVPKGAGAAGGGGGGGGEWEFCRARVTGGGFPVVQPSGAAMHLGGDLYMRHYALATARELRGLPELQATPRFIDLRGNAYISPLPPPPRPGADIVGEDIADIARVLKAIRLDWADAGGHNRLSAAKFAELLLRRARERRAGDAANKVDLVVTGCEISLWIAENWVSDLKKCMPSLTVLAISANKIIDVYGSKRGEKAVAGSAFSRRTADLSGAVGLAVSHSGNTFATTQATLLLKGLTAGRTFCLVRNTDTLMSSIVGQRLDRSAPRCPFVFTNGAGWRPAEPSSVAAAALHQTLTELLLCLVFTFDSLSIHERPFGIVTSPTDAHALDSLAHTTVEKHVPLITGRTAAGAPATEPDPEHPARTRPSAYHAKLVEAGRRWGMHVIEAPLVWALASLYVWLSVFFGVSLFRVLLSGYDHCSGGICAPGYGLDGRYQWLHRFLDSWLYVWCVLAFTLLLRLVQRRPLLARLGRRTVVVGDAPYVHQCLEAFLSKLFALSYSIASVDVHGGSPADHLVHRFTHRVARGVLLAVGRPDGRVCALTKAESSTMLSICQAKSIQNLGRSGGPELVTIGHNPWTHEQMIDTRIVLPSERGQFLCEAVSGLKSYYRPRQRAPSIVASLGSLAKRAGLSNRGVRPGRGQDESVHLGFSPGEIMSAGAAAVAAKAEMSRLELLVMKHQSNIIGAESIIYSKALALSKRRGSGSGARRGSGGPAPPPAPAPTRAQAPAPASPALKATPVHMKTISVHLEGPASLWAIASSPAGPPPAARRRRPRWTRCGRLGASGSARAGLRRFRAAAERVLAEQVRPRLAAGRRAAAAEGPSLGRFQALVMKLVHERRAVISPHSRATQHTFSDLSLPVQAALEAQQPLEELAESRLFSMERMVAFMVMFHAMAARVAAFPLLGFDLARSQSSLRVASTAAPASGAEIAQALAAMADRAQRAAAEAERRGAPAAGISMEQARRRLSFG
eukprot:tig00020560_g11082.t1